MNKILTILAVVCLLGFGFVGGSKAANSKAQAELTFDATDLIGAQVRNPGGKILGSISDLVFDPKGRPIVAILCQGDLEDLDVTREVAVPFSALSISDMGPSQMRVVLNIGEEELFSAPRFDRTKDLKDLNDMKWIAGVYRYFGQQPYWTEEETEKGVSTTNSPPFVLAVSQVFPAYVDGKQESAQLVEKARLTLDSFMNDSNMGAFRDLLKKARGVLIAPALLKGAFNVGASGCNAVFLVRDRKTGQWSEPAFYTIGGGSFGLQIIGEASKVVLLVMTDRGIRALLGNSVKLGWDASISVGPFEMGATSNLSADILSFSRSKGLYGGVLLDGAVVALRGDLNDAYYDKKELSPKDILVLHDVENPQAMSLIKDIAKSAA